jgi:probable rRNA maturation factor
VRIYNGDPGLRLDRRALIAVLRCLDSHAPAILGRPPPLVRLPSTITHHPSAIAPRLPAPPAIAPGELSLAFLTPAGLARLHATFLDDPSATDVITFDGAPGSGQAGEICVSAGAAAAFAARRGRGFSEELTLYVVHGWLHLAGHDDHTPAQKRRMRAAEARAMAVLQAHRLIPRFALAG